MQEIQARGRDVSRSSDRLARLRELLRIALKRVRLTFAPALLASLPLIALVSWISSAYGYAYPGTGERVEIRAFSGGTAPKTFEAFWVIGEGSVERAQGLRIVVYDAGGRFIADLSLAAPIPLLHKWRWWNVLFRNPAGYVPEKSPIERIELDLPRKRYLGFASAWAGSWEIAVATHRYRDYPMLYTPYAWNRFLDRVPKREIPPSERQHDPFLKGQAYNIRARRHMKRVGHFEFGVDRRPINFGDRTSAEEVAACWERGEELVGWARYWNHIYLQMVERLDASPKLRQATHVVRFEDLCNRPAETIEAIVQHCALARSEALVARAKETLGSPSYYRPEFTAKELATIDHYTSETAARFGYPVSSATPV